MAAYFLFLLFIIMLVGRYNVAGIRLSKDFTIPFAMLVIAGFSILRFDVGFDYVNYYTMITTKTWEIKKLEPIPMFIANLALSYNSPFIFFCIIGTLTYFFIYKALKDNSVCYYESLLIYLCVFYLDSFGFVRQTLAGSLVFWAFKFVRQKSILKYSLVCFVAFFIHKSSIVAFFIYFIYNYVPFLLSCFFLSLLLVLKNIVLSRFALLNLYNSYLNATQNFSGGGKLQFFYIAVLVFCFFLSIQFKNYKDVQKYLSVLSYGCVVPFIFGSHIGGRLALYFNIYLCLLWSRVFQKTNIKIRALLMLMFYLFFFFYLYISTKNPDKAPFTPYQIYFIAPHVFK